MVNEENSINYKIEQLRKEIREMISEYHQLKKDFEKRRA